MDGEDREGKKMIIKMIRRPIEIVNPMNLLGYESFVVALDTTRNPFAVIDALDKINSLSSRGYNITRVNFKDKNYFQGVRS